MPAAPRSAPGFVSLQDYLSANQGAVGQTASTLADAASAKAQTAQDEANKVGSEARQSGQATRGAAGFDATSLPDYAKAQSDAASAQQQLSGLSTYGGLSQQLQSRYGNQGYAAGDRNLDAQLLGGGAAQGAFKAAQGRFQGLQDYLGQQANAGYAAGAQAGAGEGQGAVNTRVEPGQNPYAEPGDRQSPSNVKNNPGNAQPQVGSGYAPGDKLQGQAIGGDAGMQGAGPFTQGRGAFSDDRPFKRSGAF